MTLYLSSCASETELWRVVHVRSGERDAKIIVLIENFLDLKMHRGFRNSNASTNPKR